MHPISSLDERKMEKTAGKKLTPAISIYSEGKWFAVRWPTNRFYNFPSFFKGHKLARTPSLRSHAAILDIYAGGRWLSRVPRPGMKLTALKIRNYE
jgi:hypothetical protein